MPAKRQDYRRPKWFEQYVPEEVANSSLFKFTIVLRDRKIQVDMVANLDIDYGNVQQQLEDAPAEFAYWGAIYSELKLQVSLLERHIRSVRGKIAERIVKEAMAAGMRVTDKQVQAIVDADDTVRKLETQYAILQKHTGKAYFMVEALRMKNDNLRSLAGFVRQEMQQQQDV